jgi:hypothetical protein
MAMSDDELCFLDFLKVFRDGPKEVWITSRWHQDLNACFRADTVLDEVSRQCGGCEDGSRVCTGNQNLKGQM